MGSPRPHRLAQITGLSAVIALVLCLSAPAPWAAPVFLEGQSVDLSSGTVSQRLAPEVAYNSIDDEYMAIWFDTRNPGNNDVFGQRLGADGVLRGDNFPVIEFAEAQIDPAISHAPVVNSYLAGWRTQQAGYFNKGRGRILLADGSHAGSDFLIGNGHEMSLVFSTEAEEWLSTARSPDIRGQRISSSGTLVGGGILLSSSGAPAPNGQAAYDPNNQRYLATFRNQVAERLEGRLVSVDGTLPGGIFTISDVFPASGRAAAAAFDPVNERYLVVFGMFQGTDVLGQFVDPDGTLIGPMLTIGSGLPSQVDPALAYDAAYGGYVVVWYDGSRITAQGLTADGEPDGDPAHFAVGTATGRARLAASTSSNQLLAVWSDSRNVGTGEPDIYAQRLRTGDISNVPGGGPAAVRWIACAPNPMVERTTVRFALTTSGRPVLEIVDAGGRVVRLITAGPLGPGEHRFQWDRTDASGRRVASGAYFLRIRGAGTQAPGPKLIAIR